MFFVKDLVQITPKVNLQARVKCVYEHILYLLIFHKLSASFNQKMTSQTGGSITEVDLSYSLSTIAFTANE